MAIIHVHPGHYSVGHRGDELRTLLGSCVAVTLWHPKRHVGAMNHILLPARLVHHSDSALDGRYAHDAWILVCKGLAELGVTPQECVCKVFGGASVLPGSTGVVGERNIASVKKILQDLGIHIDKEHVAGKGYRDVRFNLSTGDAWVRQASARLFGQQPG